MLGQNLQEECSTPKSMSQTELQFSYVEKQTALLGEMLARLSNKLTPILRVNPPQTIGKQKDAESLTSLAGQIRKIGRDMGNFAGQIESILERLEL